MTLTTKEKAKVQMAQKEKVIYLDNQATTPLDPKVFEVMKPYFLDEYGNPASRSHVYGWHAEEAVNNVRQILASALNAADPKEIIFTSGATESNNIAIMGIAEMYKDQGKHIITANIEHKAVLDPCKHLEAMGFKVTYLPVDQYGQVDPQKVKAAITDETILITIMHANNEIGTINPIKEIGAIAAEHNIIFHTDAAQTLGKIPIDVQDMNIHLLSASGHKIYGPKGIGMLYVRRRNPRVRISPIIFGGGHERGVRSGTLNVPGIVGFGEAVRIAIPQMESESKRLSAMRDQLKERLMSELDEVYLNGHPTQRLPHNLNLSFAFVEGESLLMGFTGLAVSSGSACTSASLEPSYVLKNIGVGEDLAHTSIRFSFGRFNDEKDLKFIGDQVIQVVKRLREMSPLYEMFKEGIDISKIKWAGAGH